MYLYNYEYLTRYEQFTEHSLGQCMICTYYYKLASKTTLYCTCLQIVLCL